jgi:hypothetical protein
MNWTIVVYFGPMFLVMCWWFISARKWFKGPRVNVNHMMLGREGNVIEGENKSADGDSSSDNVPADTKSAPVDETTADVKEVK